MRDLSCTKRGSYQRWWGKDRWQRQRKDATGDLWCSQETFKVGVAENKPAWPKGKFGHRGTQNCYKYQVKTEIVMVV